MSLYAECEVMYQSNRSFNIPQGNPPGIWIFEKNLVQIPPSPGQKAVQMPPSPRKLFSSFCYASEAVQVNMVY